MLLQEGSQADPSETLASASLSRPPPIYLPEGTIQLSQPFNSCLVGDVEAGSKERLPLHTTVMCQHRHTRTHTCKGGGLST